MNTAAVEAAAGRIAGVANRTPVLRSDRLDARLGLRLFFKCENLQRGGAFKFRGAYNALCALDAKERARGVVTFSSGNHAQGLALAAKLLGVGSTIVMPRDAPAIKIAATQRLGAEIIFYERLEQKREAIARRLAAERGSAVIPPFDHPEIIAGQGTAALELRNQAPPLDALVVPIGGGGLIAGCCVALAGPMRPRIFGVEPETAPDAHLSLKAGERVETPQGSSIADGLLPTCPGELTFPIMQQHLEDIALVSEHEIAEAVPLLVRELRTVVEPSGAASAAALLAGKIRLPPGSTVGVIVSGGNVDPSWLSPRLAATTG